MIISLVFSTGWCDNIIQKWHTPFGSCEWIWSLIIEWFKSEFNFSFRFTICHGISCTSASRGLGYCADTWLLDVNSLAHNLAFHVRNCLMRMFLQWPLISGASWEWKASLVISSNISNHGILVLAILNILQWSCLVVTTALLMYPLQMHSGTSKYNMTDDC